MYDPYKAGDGTAGSFYCSLAITPHLDGLQILGSVAYETRTEHVFIITTTIIYNKRHGMRCLNLREAMSSTSCQALTILRSVSGEHQWQSRCRKPMLLKIEQHAGPNTKSTKVALFYPGSGCKLIDHLIDKQSSLISKRSGINREEHFFI